ncbi:dienelactone hydrolase family protein [Archangium violaceum]|uniref:dienelactone hydrolase family protein n=1 Tax=Archangium violaceum TaxID=83451 RepID=UPI00193C48F0|nr:dienelactone hydrolase family protein [Archangium violaceum]QRK07512.1 dienelactone hydrolase family protein [Archangium violaceum]
MERLTGARHGYAVEGRAAYDKDASEKHWERLLDLFGRTPRGSRTAPPGSG